MQQLIAVQTETVVNCRRCVQMQETETLAQETALLEAQAASLRRLAEQAEQLAQMPRISTAFADAAATLHILQAAQQSYDEQASAGARRGRQNAAAGFAACVSRLADLADGFRVSSDPGRSWHLAGAQHSLSRPPHLA